MCNGISLNLHKQIESACCFVIYPTMTALNERLVQGGSI